VKGEIIRRASLAPPEVSAMYALFASHFDGVSERRFRADLAEKQWIVRVVSGGRLRGFSSLKFTLIPHLGRDIAVLSSGDTIIAPEARSTTVLARTWIAAVNRLRDHYGTRELSWLLLVSGFRTYRLLPVFWREFYPCCTRPTPAAVQERIDHIAASLFGAQYSSADGIVRFREPQVLKPEHAGIPEPRQSDPHVAFFAARNRGHSQGDELVCWTRLAHENLTDAGVRMWEAGAALAFDSSEGACVV
jgi:hypothetical protein